SNELIHIYSARGLKKTRKKVDEREISSVKTYSTRRLRSMMKEGRLVDGKTLLALFFSGI
ncbi:MAG: hypothetical protein R6X07_11445, partial [Desulfatiglandales bacterium]